MGGCLRPFMCRGDALGGPEVKSRPSTETTEGSRRRWLPSPWLNVSPTLYPVCSPAVATLAGTKVSRNSYQHPGQGPGKPGCRWHRPGGAVCRAPVTHHTVPQLTMVDTTPSHQHPNSVPETAGVLYMTVSLVHRR